MAEGSMDSGNAWVSLFMDGSQRHAAGARGGSAGGAWGPGGSGLGGGRQGSRRRTNPNSSNSGLLGVFPDEALYYTASSGLGLHEADGQSYQTARSSWESGAAVHSGGSWGRAGRPSPTVGLELAELPGPSNPLLPQASPAPQGKRTDRPGQQQQ